MRLLTRTYWALFFSTFLFSLRAVADDTDPCITLLNVIDRPNESDSVCVVKSGHLLVEMGYEAYSIYPQNGRGFVTPQTEVRLGLPFQSELSILLPTYYRENMAHSPVFTGPSATNIGLKHQFKDINTWLFAAEGFFILPAGNEWYGSQGVGFYANGIVNVGITDTLSAGSMLGFSTETEPYGSGGNRFNSFNPEVLLAWQPVNSFQIYLEAYGQTKTSATDGPGFNMDVGLLFLITPRFALDLSYGHRISGNVEGYEQYLDVGGSLMVW